MNTVEKHCRLLPVARHNWSTQHGDRVGITLSRPSRRIVDINNAIAALSRRFPPTL
jgi:hypothetical protein